MSAETGSDPSVAATLGQSVSSGIRWKLFGQSTVQATSVIAGIALAHLLTPRQFGLAGMAVVFTGLGAIFGDLALSAALVQRRLLTEEDRSTAFWTNVAAGCVLTGAGVAVSPFVADFFGNAQVGPLFAASSGQFLLWSLSATQTALLTRSMNFRSLELRTIISGIVGAVAAVALAWFGAGAWALIGELLVTAVVSLVMLWSLSDWRPRFVYSTSSLRSFGSFSGKTLQSQFLAYLVLNMDNLLVGRFLGSRALGIYSVAYTTMFLPIARISQPIQQVMFAALSRIQSEPVRFRETWLRGNRLVAAANVPVFFGIAVVAPDFVPVVLGHRWGQAVPVLQLLSLAGACDSFQGLNWSALQAAGNAGVMLRLRLFSTPLTVGAFALGLHWGIVGVAGFFAVARLIVVGMSLIVTSRSLGSSIRLPIRGDLFVLVLAVLMGGAVFLARIGLVHAQVPAVVRLVVVVAVGVVVYVLLLAWRAPDLLRELRAFVPGRRKAR